jgi:hypothetical protein
MADGLTSIDGPVPTRVPPQLPVYHFQLAPVPSEPPTSVSVELLPVQMVVGLAVAPVGAVDVVQQALVVELATTL